MAYIFKQKINLADLAALGQEPKKVLIYEPESELGALYAHYLRAHNFDIRHCPYLASIRQFIAEFEPHLLIFNAESSQALLEISRVSRNFPAGFPRLISTGYNLSGQKIGELMSAGVASHINRKLSRPQDLAILVETILK